MEGENLFKKSNSKASPYNNAAVGEYEAKGVCGTGRA